MLGSDGSVWGWGANNLGELGLGTTTGEPQPVKILGASVAGISAGGNDALALLGNGNVLAWGNGLFGGVTSSLTPVVIPSLTGVTQISAGGDYSLAVHQVPAVSVPGGVSGTLRR